MGLYDEAVAAQVVVCAAVAGGAGEVRGDRGAAGVAGVEVLGSGRGDRVVCHFGNLCMFVCVCVCERRKVTLERTRGR